MNILVLNCGSSSIKYQVFDMRTEKVLVRGGVEKIGEAQPVQAHNCNGSSVSRQVEAKSHIDAIARMQELLNDAGGPGVPLRFVAVGHRVVHGGEHFVQSTLIDDGVEKIIEDYFSLAPLHNPPNLVGIRAARQYYDDIPHVAVFDTSFHQTMPPRAYLYAIRYDLYEKAKVRRYGFHGTSHRYVAQRAAQILGTAPDAFTGITAHLGNGCSLAAIQNGHSVDTSMGLTPLEGVAMGTRSGDIDPAIIFYLAERMGMSLDEINKVLNRESGLKGLSGLSNDLREIEKAAAEGHPRAKIAAEVYAYRIRKYIGSFLAALHKPHTIVFTGGVGERGTQMRARILADLDHLGIQLDESRNGATSGVEGTITRDGSPIRALVVPTNEELMIARDTMEVATACGVIAN